MQVVLPINNLRIGTCPHGLPPGACPICSGIGGGARRADSTARAGEMSWSECAAIGAMLKARAQARAARAQDLQAPPVQISFQAAMTNAAQKMATLPQTIASHFPPAIARPVNAVLNTIGRMANFVNQQVLKPFGQFFADISDKLTAMKGELKAALKEKTEKFLSKFKKGFKSVIAKEAEG